MVIENIEKSTFNIEKNIENLQILEIEDQIINLHEPSRKFVPIKIKFESFKFQKKTSYLSMKNSGKVALNLFWEPSIFDSNDILSQKEKIFYFSKFVSRIIPDQEIKLPIHFYSSKVRVFSERLHLKLNPPFSADSWIELNLFGKCMKKYKSKHIQIFNKRSFYIFGVNT